MDIQELFTKINSFFSNLFKNQYFIYFLTILSFFLCLFWYLERMDNAYYTSDDILDYIIEPYQFLHGRIISETISVCLIKEIPDLLGININDFAIFTKGIFTGITVLFSSFLLTNTLGKNMPKNLYFPLTFVFISFFLYFLIIKNGDALLTVFAFFIAYIFPLPIFIFHWNKIANLYISEEKATKKDYIILLLTSLFLAQANEMMLITNILLFGFIAFETIVKWIKKEKGSYCWSFAPLFLMIIVGFLIHHLQGSKDMQTIYIQFDNSLLSFEKFWFYFQHCMTKLIENNIFFFTTIAFSSFIVFMIKNEIKAKKIFRIICYTIGSLFVFFIALYFLNDSCHYADSLRDNLPSWWFLYFSLLAQLEIILFLIALFLFQIILSKTEKKKFFNILMIFFVLLSFTFVKKNERYFKDNYYKKTNLVHLYKMDKIALHSLKTQPYIYVIAEKMDNYYTIEKDNETMPYDLKTQNYNNKVYFLTHDGQKKLPYLEYLEEVYGVKANKKIIFDTEKNLIKKFQKDGLTFSKSELEEPNFEELENIYKEEK